MWPRARVEQKSHRFHFPCWHYHTVSAGARLFFSLKKIRKLASITPPPQSCGECVSRGCSAAAAPAGAGLAPPPTGRVSIVSERERRTLERVASWAQRRVRRPATLIHASLLGGREAAHKHHGPPTTSSAITSTTQMTGTRPRQGGNERCKTRRRTNGGNGAVRQAGAGGRSGVERGHGREGHAAGDEEVARGRGQVARSCNEAR